MESGGFRWGLARSFKILMSLACIFYAMAAHAWSSSRLPDFKYPHGGLVNAHVDLNRDGYIDMISSWFDTQQKGIVEIRYGGPSGFKQKADWRYEGSAAYARLGSSPLAVDVNGDGWPDLIVGEIGYSGERSRSGAIYVFFGGPNGFADRPSQTIEGPETNSLLGFTMKSLGDFNKDGFADIAVGVGTENGDRGNIWIFTGSPIGLKLRPESTITTATPMPFNYFGRMFDTGDVTGDGISDIVVGVPTANEFGRPGMVYVYKGAVSGYTSTVYNKIVEPVHMNPVDGFGSTVTIIGDVDGDGYADIAVAAPKFYDGPNSGLTISSGRIFVFFGGANGFSNAGRIQKLAAPDEAGFSFFGEVMLGQRDFNADGYADLIVGTSLQQGGVTGTDPVPGFIWLYTGGPNGFTKTPYKRSGTPGSRDGLGVELDAADINGDGQMDIITSMPGDRASPGDVRVYRGQKGLK